MTRDAQLVRAAILALLAVGLAAPAAVQAQSFEPINTRAAGMVPTPAIRNLIRDDKVHQIYSTMQTGQEKLGMQTMNQSLASLYMRATR